jgi:hypothetical protein
MNTPRTKPGQYGTLYLYAVTYTDPSDFAIGELVQRIWAYNIEHALDRFYGSEDADGWKALRVARVLEGVSQHRAISHEVG